MSERVYVTGIMPVNPIIRDKVYIISDIQTETPITDVSGVSTPLYSFVVDEIIELAEYVKRVESAHSIELAEIDEALFELAGGGA